MRGHDQQHISSVQHLNTGSSPCSCLLYLRFVLSQVSEKLAKIIPDDSLTDGEKAKAVRLEVKKALEERYKALAGVKSTDKVATGVTYFFRKLRF